MIVFPNCKINLGLNILQKRADGFHDLETVFYPVALQDALEIVQSPFPNIDIEFTSSGLEIPSTTEQNICVKAYRLLKKDIPQLPPIKMHLHKVIPSGAGLGGGSSNGAFVLTSLNKKFSLGLTEDKLINYALQLGSDCPFFIKNHPCFATGRGEKLEEIGINLSHFKIVLVNPRIYVGTRQAFSEILPDNRRKRIKDIIKMPVDQWKNELNNDFETTVFTQHPEIKQVKQKMYQQGAVYASMSGSGSTVYGLFNAHTQPQFDFPAQYFIKTL